jgi:hypothetical protein
MTSVVYLGHRILPNGMAHWSKVIAILEMRNPIDVHTLRSFIGLCNYYMIYVQNFSIIAHPLYALFKKDVAWTWSEKAHEAFNTLKEKLSKLCLYFRSMSSTLFTNLVLHIRTQIPCCGEPSLPLKIFQKSGKTRLDSNNTCILCIYLSCPTTM